MEIKQIPSKEVLGFLDSAEEKPYSLLDVRTPEEWNEIGRPDGEKLSLKTHFVSLKLGEERKMNENSTATNNQHTFIHRNFFGCNFLHKILIHLSFFA